MSNLNDSLLNEMESDMNDLADDLTTERLTISSSKTFKNGKTVYTFGNKQDSETSSEEKETKPKKNKRQWIGGQIKMEMSTGKYRFEDAMVTNLVLDRILLIDKGILSLALMSLGLSILEYNLEFNYKAEDKSNTGRIYNILLIVSVINILTLIFNILRYGLMNKFFILKGMIDPDETLRSSGKFP